MEWSQLQNSKKDHDENKQPAHRIRLPGFVVEKEIGLGDVIKRATSAFGIKPCGECKKRALSLNEWISFGPPK